MSAHTPGPWKVNAVISPRILSHSETMDIYVYAPSFSQAAICGGIVDPVTQEPSEANARLIAAAPDMLEALKDMNTALWSSPSCQNGLTHCRCAACSSDRARAAIAKATGQP